MNKVLSVIIPTYNMEDYLDKCLTSLIVSDPQLMKQLEVLIVIDGAKDHSSEIAHRYQDRFPDSFHVIDKENGNYGSCINRGLKEASGKYVKILDADDSYDNRFFLDYLKFLQSSDEDLIVNDIIIVNPKGRKRKRSSFALPTGRVFGLESLTEEMRELYAMHRVAYKTDKLRAINYTQTEGISYTDQEWIFTPLVTVETISYFDRPLYRYVIGREGQTMDPKVAIRQINHHIIGAKKMINDYLAFSNLSREQQKMLDQRLILRVSKIYYDYLCNPSLDLDELIAFDDYLLEKSTKIYDMVGSASLTWLIKNKYIIHWRENGRKKHLNKNMLVLARCTQIIRSIKWRLFPTIR